jgi:hypothetical protein
MTGTPRRRCAGSWPAPCRVRAARLDVHFKGTLIVQLQAAGPVSLLVVECTADLGLRATAQWRDAAGALPDDAPLQVLAGDPAASRLAIMLDPRDGGPVYQGIVALEAASIASLIEHYLTTSEQIDSRLVLAADATRVRGLLLQRMPSAVPGTTEVATGGPGRPRRCRVAEERRRGRHRRADHDRAWSHRAPHSIALAPLSGVHAEMFGRAEMRAWPSRNGRRTASSQLSPRSRRCAGAVCAAQRRCRCAGGCRSFVTPVTAPGHTRR